MNRLLLIYPDQGSGFKPMLSGKICEISIKAEKKNDRQNLVDLKKLDFGITDFIQIICHFMTCRPDTALPFPYRCSISILSCCASELYIRDGLASPSHKNLINF